MHTELHDQRNLEPSALERVLRGVQAPEVRGATSERSAPFVFLVSGHSRERRDTVAQVIEHLGLRVVILDEEPSRGHTVLEKLERTTSVAFAVVLITGDDVGSVRGNTTTLAPRPRQNVLLELGFLFGALGRGRICILYDDAVELPSDLAGLRFITLDSAGGWRFMLAREFKAAGLPVDLNGLLQ